MCWVWSTRTRIRYWRVWLFIGKQGSSKHTLLSLPTILTYTQIYRHTTYTQIYRHTTYTQMYRQTTYTQLYRHTTYTQIYRHTTYTQIYRQTTYTQIYRHTNTHTHRYTDIQHTHRYTDKQHIHKYTDIQTPIHTNIQTRTYSTIVWLTKKSNLYFSIWMFCGFCTLHNLTF